MPTACVFCEIVSGRASADVVHSDNTTVSFLDARPLFPGHTLVVPRVHAVTIEDLTDDLIASVFRTVRILTAAVRRAVGAEGAFIAQNNVVSQSVPHVHVHVVPRARGDGLRGFFWPRTGYADDAHRGRVAAAIRSQIVH